MIAAVRTSRWSGSRMAWVLRALLVTLPLGTIGCESGAEDPAAGPFGQPEEAGLGLSLIPITTTSREAAHHYRFGRQALEAGRRALAREHFTLAAAADPGFALARIGLASTALSPAMRARYVSGASALTEGVSEGERLLVELTSHELSRDAASWLESARLLAERYPEAPRSAILLGRAQAAIGAVSDARAAFAQALALDPSFVPARVALVRSYLEDDPRDPGLALQIVERAGDRLADDPALLLARGDALFALWRYDEALASYERAARLDAESVAGLARAGAVRAALGSFDEARRLYDQAIEKADPLEAGILEIERALVHVHADAPSPALARLFDLASGWESGDLAREDREALRARALEAAARIGLHHGLLTVTERALGQRDELLRAWAAGVEQPEVRRRLEASILHFGGLLEARRGDYPAARESARRLAEWAAASPDPGAAGWAHEVLGVVDLEGDLASEAVRQLESTDLRDIYNVYQLAVALSGAGRDGDALALYQRIAAHPVNSVGLALVRRTALERLP